MAAVALVPTAGAAPAPHAAADAGAGGAYACRQQAHVPAPGVAPAGRGHVAGLVETPAGDLLYSFDSDPLLGEDSHGRGWPVTRTFTTRLEPGERTWPWPEPISYDNPDAVHNAVLFNDGEGRIHNFFTTRQGPNHVHSTLDYRYSDDDGHTWSEPDVLREEWGWMFGNRPFRMSNGEAIVPVYKEGAPWGVGFFVSDDDFATYEVHPPGDLPWPGAVVGGLQAATTELEPGHLLAYLRTNAQLIYETRSFDYGRTWTPAVPTRFPNPWARVDLLKLDSGNLLLAYNPSSSDRTPLRLALSEDDGLTWSYEVDVEDAPNVSYPFLFQGSDGSVHLGYGLRGTGGAMGHFVFNEEFVRSGPDLPSDPAGDLKRVEYRDGEVREVEVCAYAWGQGLPGDQEPYACRQEVYDYDSRFPGVHAASIEQLGSGDLLYTFFGGSGEGANDVAVWGSRLAVGSSDWTQPEVLYDDPGKPEGNSVVWNSGDGRTFLFFVTQQGNSWSEANLRFTTSDDDGHTWSEPRWLREELGWMLGNRAERLSNGDVILPLYAEPAPRAERTVGFAISTDDWETWDFYPEDPDEWLASPSGSIQAEAVEVSPGHLLAYMRTYDGFVYATESFDYGRTWTEPYATDLENPSARVALLKLDNGNLVVAHNPPTGTPASDRSRLRVSLSEDGGQTWPYGFDVERSPGSEFSYPWLVQSEDGNIHLAYTYKRLSMRHAVFNEAYVRTGEDLVSVPPVDTPFYSTSSRVLFQAGLAPVNVCDYSPG